MDPSVPLVVPEVNAADIAGNQGIIANPNCVAAPLVVALKPIADAVGLERVIVSSYQSVSGTGAAAIEELRAQTAGNLAGDEPAPQVYPHPIAFNVLPHIDVTTDVEYVTYHCPDAAPVVPVRECERYLGEIEPIRAIPSTKYPHERGSSTKSRRYEGWIDDQFALPRATSHWDWLNANGYNVAANINSETGFDATMWRQMIVEPDQLRQRIGMALLDGDRFVAGDTNDGLHVADVSDMMRRVIKEDLYRFDGRRLFPKRKAYTVPYKLSEAEMDLYGAVAGRWADLRGRASWN